jgi:uncharacterized glyoxalase superfamily protein PhnB
MAAAKRKMAATRKRKPASARASRRPGRVAGRKVTAGRRASRGKRKAAAPAPSVVPMISYEDGIAALEWLANAFGFREVARLTAPDGRLWHGEMQAGTGLIMLASPTPDYRSPRSHRETCEQARKWSEVPWIIDGVLVFVDDLDGHFARARASGATILSSIEEGAPARRYRAEDLEGHRWFFHEKA